MFSFFKSKPKPGKRSAPRPRNLEAILCFEKNTFALVDILRLVDTAPLKVEQYEVEGEEIPFTAEVRQALLSLSPDEAARIVSRGIRFSSASGAEQVRFNHPATSVPPLVMYYQFEESKRDVIVGEWFESLLHHPRFVVGYCGDHQDMMLQSVTSALFVKAQGGKPKRTYKNEFGDLTIDLSFNPGRRKVVSGMILMACWRMWFGPPFNAVVSRDRLKAFAKAHSLVDSDPLMIELYADPFSADADSSRAVQNLFRQWVDMDALEKKLW